MTYKQDHALPPLLPTMADVARASGVSAMTVSRALREGSPVSSRTRQKVLDVVESLGYVPDRSAGSLSSRRSGLIGAVLGSLTDACETEVARGISETLAGSDLQVLIGHCENDPVREERVIEAMLRRRPEAMVISAGGHTPRARRLLEGAGIPVIESWDAPAAPIDSVVGFSHQAAAGALVRTLQAQGCKRIAYLGAEHERDPRAEAIRRGVLFAQSRQGQPPVPAILAGSSEQGGDAGARAIIKLLERHPDVDGVVCASDNIAFGALMECWRRGVPVPERLAIASFGDTEVARHAFPPITTVSINRHGMGVEIAKLILAAVAHGGRGRRTVRGLRVPVDYHIIERASSLRLKMPERAPDTIKERVEI